MASRSNALLERFLTALISGDRPAAREIVAETFASGCSAEEVVAHLIWPTAEKVQTMHRSDQMGELAYHFATRTLRSLADQIGGKLSRRPSREQTALVVCGEEECEELAGQLAADLLEADGYRVYFAGGGVANDEIVAQLGEIDAHKLVVFGAVPSTAPQTRLLIDRLHELGACPDLQIIVGGGVFNRAEGLAEEIGADLWARTPSELVATMDAQPERRMASDQRTVGRRRRVAAA
ncbi:MAG: cobalamin-dependent protein [Planctomycetota bacterium]